MALDCARAALRLGKQVTWGAPEAFEDKKVIPEESVYAAQEGVHIEVLVKPLEIMGNDRHFARAVKCVRLDYADTRATGHWELTPVPDSGFVLEADSVIVAMGHAPNSLIKRDVPQLKVNDDGTIWTDSNDSTTSLRGVFACGNAVTNTTAVVDAMASGKKAAEHIDAYLKTNK
ncbi:MAG: FAD-dependent oxidoreductase [Candidatus Omnitrophica bacterium]|nr:FAD-dependent oxidoreductase [Candidatus Omnitrophota bacterium]